MSFFIVPGAVIPVPTAKAAEAERFAQNQILTQDESVFSLRRKANLPEQGGVGMVPLPIVHQGHLPICTGVAAANGRSILHYQQSGVMLPFSGLFIYKMNRLFDGLDREAKGSTLAASMQTLTYKGVCPERMYPSNFKNCNRAFPRDGRRLLQAAQAYQIKKYRRCDGLQEILLALADGAPVVFSMVIYTDFYEAKNGVVPPIRRGNRIGGHSMVAINYDLSRELVQVVQSWGTAGNGPTDRGYMYIPFAWFDFIDDLTAHKLLIEAFALQA